LQQAVREGGLSHVARRWGMATGKRRLTKPKSVREDPYRNKKWNEVVRGRDETRRPEGVQHFG